MNTQEARIKTARRVFITVVLAIGFALIVSALSGCGVRLVRSGSGAGKAPQINIGVDGSIKPSEAFLHEYENFLLHNERAAAQQEKERNHLLAQIPVTHYYDAQRRLMLVRPASVPQNATAPPPASSPGPAAAAPVASGSEPSPSTPDPSAAK